MATKIKEFAGSLGFILGATVIVNFAALLLGRSNIENSQDWPGWVQAIGSIEAILIAVWVSWQQTENQRQREIEKDTAELKGLLRALRTEIKGSIEQARYTLGQALKDVTASTPYLCTLPISDDPFDIYNAMLPRLGLIEDDALRDQIVRTYQMAKGLVLTLRYHNELVAAYERAQLQFQMVESDATKRELTVKVAELSGYSPVLRDSYEKVNKEVDTLFPMLARY
jgi:hypothetical protein